MTEQRHNDLWDDFPKTAQEFEAQFATEEGCRAWWIKARWGDKPACARCKSKRVWTERNGFLFECADCGHQTSLTSGTLLEKTRKPFKVWFRAVFEISTQRTGISAKDLQRLLGFGSYKTAWTWLHKLRSALVRPEREPLGPFVQMDETLVGGKGGPHKELVLVAVEVDGRVRLAHAENNDADTLKVLVSRQVVEDASIVTDGHAGYNDKSLEKRPHEAVVQTKQERREKRRRPELPLDNLTVEALADRHARGRGARQAPAGLSRRKRQPNPARIRRAWAGGSMVPCCR